MYAIDTNIWIYCQDCRDLEKQRKALELVAATHPLALPWQVGCEFIAASRKLANSGFSQEQSWRSLDEMRAMADIVLLPTPELWAISKELTSAHQISFWDGMLLAACVNGGVKTLFTEDLNHGSTIVGVGIVNPFR